MILKVGVEIIGTVPKLRIAARGCRFAIGRIHADCWKQLSTTEWTAACDIKNENLEQFADDYGISIKCWRLMLYLTGKMLLAAENVDSSFVNVGGGHREPTCPSNVFSAHPANWKDEALEVLAVSCIQVLGQIPIRQTRLVLETRMMTPLDSPQKVRQLYDQVNHPQFGFLFDSVNLMNLNRYFRTGEFIRECVDILGDDIALVHLKDTILKPDTFRISLMDFDQDVDNMMH